MQDQETCFPQLRYKARIQEAVRLTTAVQFVGFQIGDLTKTYFLVILFWLTISAMKREGNEPIFNLLEQVLLQGISFIV